MYQPVIISLKSGPNTKSNTPGISFIRVVGPNKRHRTYFRYKVLVLHIPVCHTYNIGTFVFNIRGLSAVRGIYSFLISYPYMAIMIAASQQKACTNGEVYNSLLL